MDRTSLRLRAALAFFVAAPATLVLAQTTAGIGTTIVFPVTAQTASFASEVTLFNPGPSSLTASVKFYEANNSATPGLKTCTDVSVAAARSAQIKLSTQCTLTAASHFGLLLIADKASPQSNNFYGYMRVQNPQGIGFSVEGFPVQNFNNQVAEATGLMKQAAAPGYQTNCFVGSLDLPVSYTLKLFNGFTGSQIGGTLAGSLTAYQQIRYLDVFGSTGVNAPAGDQFNVRAEFTQTAGGAGNLIGFCTVQDNTSFGADFRVAKSYGSPSGTFFAQGGNAFGTTATLGTTDASPLHIIVNGARVMRYEQTADSPNVIGGSVYNGVVPGVVGATIGGGGTSGTSYDGIPCSSSFACRNVVTGNFGTVGGGVSNVVGSNTLVDSAYGTVSGGIGNTAYGRYSTVSGGAENTASGGAGASVGGGTNNAASDGTVGGGFHNTAGAIGSTVAGGQINMASGYDSTIGGGDEQTASGASATIGGGESNTASGEFSTVPGGDSNSAAGANSVVLGTRGETLAAATGSFVFSDASGTAMFGSGKAGEFLVAATGGIGMWTEKDYNTGCKIPAGSGTWTCSSSRELKHDFAAIDAASVLSKVVALPITTWRYKTEVGALHLGPVAEDFRAAFGLGADDRSITTSDESGIALAAIQGLNRLVLREDADIRSLRQEDADIRRAMRDKDAKIEAQAKALAKEEAELAALRRQVTEMAAMGDELAALKVAVSFLQNSNDQIVAVRPKSRSIASLDKP